MFKGFDLLFLIGQYMDEILKSVDNSILSLCLKGRETSAQKIMLQDLMLEILVKELTKDPVFTEKFVRDVLSQDTIVMAYDYFKLQLQVKHKQLYMLEKFHQHQVDVFNREWDATIEQTLSMISVSNPKSFCLAMQHVLKQCASLREVRTLHLYLKRAMRLGSFSARHANDPRIYVFDDQTNQFLENLVLEDSNAIFTAFEKYGTNYIQLKFQLIINDQTRGTWRPDDFIVRDFLTVRLTPTTTDTLVYNIYDPSYAGSKSEPEHLLRLDKV